MKIINLHKVKHEILAQFERNRFKFVPANPHNFVFYKSKNIKYKNTAIIDGCKKIRRRNERCQDIVNGII